MQPDTEWCARFLRARIDPPHATRIDYAALENAKPAFLAGNDAAPPLVYPKLKKSDCSKAEEELLHLFSDVQEREKERVVRRAYEWKIYEALGHVRLVRAAQEANDLEVVKLSRATYGIPSYELLTHILATLLSEIELAEGDSVKREAGERLRAALQFDLTPYSPIAVGDYPIPPVVPDPDPRLLSAAEVARVFQDKLYDLGFDEWRATIDPERTRHTIITNFTRNTIFIPDEPLLHEGRVRPLTRRQTQALAEHEVGVHVRRRVAGKASPLALLETGLDRMLAGEEGLAVYAEQNITGANDFARSGRYLAIALALGIDGTPRHFRDVFMIMRDVYTVRSSHSEEEAWKSAEDIAWKLCARTFRGTTGSTRGACLTKDIAYRQGNIRIWSLVRAQSPELKRVFVGKYDPANPRHRWILDQLDIRGQ